MKTKKEIRKKIEEAKKKNRELVNAEHHEGIIITQSWIKALEWILDEGDLEEKNAIK